MSPLEVQQIAERILADFDAHRPNEIFAERGSEWLTLDDAYAVQHAVAEQRRTRGEECVGYKVGCVSAAIQEQFGLREPVRGYLWSGEAHVSGCHLSHTRFANLAIEGEIAVRLSRDLPAHIPRDDCLADYVECWFPVIELHNYVFRGPIPTTQELIASNALHAGFVAPPARDYFLDAPPANAEIYIDFDGKRVETIDPANLSFRPLDSICWLATSLSGANERLKAGHLVLTGSPGRLIRVDGSAVAVTCRGRRVELFVEPDN